FDISGRTDYPVVETQKRSGFFSFPDPIKRLLVLAYFSAKYRLKLHKVLLEKIESSDVILLGGGQLISDVYLNFPLKLYLLSRYIRNNPRPCFVFSVGVSPNISKIGRFLLSRAFENMSPRRISVRDYRSRENLRL